MNKIATPSPALPRIGTADQCQARPGLLAVAQISTCCTMRQTIGEIVPGNGESKDFRIASLQEIGEALMLQHASMNAAIENIAALFWTVSAVHDFEFPELETAANLFTSFTNTVGPHMLKEERVLYPFVTRLEKAVEFGLRSLMSPFAGLRNPLRAMTEDHDLAQDLFTALKKKMTDFVVPVDACAGHALLCGALQAFERDLNQHFAIEREVLYPRALEMRSRINLYG
jgi:regulator of cell morphogenesis and NO signaling